jgi:hypothetical protein
LRKNANLAAQSDWQIDGEKTAEKYCWIVAQNRKLIHTINRIRSAG